jgi:hypothetical protein
VRWLSFVFNSLNQSISFHIAQAVDEGAAADRKKAVD